MQGREGGMGAGVWELSITHKGSKDTKFNFFFFFFFHLYPLISRKSRLSFKTSMRVLFSMYPIFKLRKGFKLGSHQYFQVVGRTSSQRKGVGFRKRKGEF